MRRKRSSVVAGLLFLVLMVVALALLNGCSGNNTTCQGATQSTTSGMSMVQVTIGDAPSDRIAAFSITINSISLSDDAGNAVSLVSSPVTVEITHLTGTTQPVATLTVPAGTYTKATIALGTATVTLVDPATGLLSQKTLPAPPTVTLTLNPAFVLSGSPLVLNLDLSLANSIAIDASGNINFNPRFIETHGPLGGSTPSPFNGGLEHLFGSVSNVSSNSFSLALGNQTLTFTTNSSTQFLNLSGVSQIAVGMLLMVSAQTQSDGSLLATRVAAVNALPASMGALGLVRTVNRATSQLQLVVRHAAGPALTPFVGSGLLVDFSSSTAFRFDADGVDLSNLPFVPTFNADNIAPGQFVEVDTTSPPVGITAVIGGLGGIEISATQITLEPEPLIGTVSGYTGGNTFTLNFQADSLFAVATKTASVTVYKQPGTTLVNLSSINNGSTVIVRGLLFVDSGTYKMVAGRVLATP
jgi:hypothetical protein